MTDAIKRNWRHLLPATLLVLAAVGLHVSPLLQLLDHQLLDAVQRYRWAQLPVPSQGVPNEDPVVVVGIDNEFLDAIDEPLALSHHYLADFFNAMRLAGPASVGVDLVLPAKRFDAITSRRKQGLDYHRVLLASLIAATQEYPLVVAKVWEPRTQTFYNINLDYAAVLDQQPDSYASQASALFHYESDGRVRHYPGSRFQPGAEDKTLSSELHAAAGLERNNWEGLINYQHHGPMNYVSIQSVIDKLNAGDQTGLKKLFEGRIVLLGTTFDDEDLLDVPVPLAAWMQDRTAVPGVLLHAHVLRSMLAEGFLREVPAAATLALSLLMVLFWLGESSRLKAGLLVGFVLALLGSGPVLLNQGIWLPPLSIVLTALLAYLGRTGWDAWLGFLERRRLNLAFGGYVSPAVLQEILDGKVSTGKSGQTVHICVLFSDIRGFTSFSENLSAEEVVRMLNEYFARMTPIVHQYGGTVDKFIGDGLMAFFGAPNRLESPEKNAFEAAKAMVRELEQLNEERAKRLEPLLAIGVGLHSGRAVVGHIGSADRHEYTAIGDTVNTAARLESASKDAGYAVILSDVVAQRVGLPPDLHSVGMQPLKGRSPMHIYGYGAVPRKSE
jgi:class 3 adenylate cyclase/CHASE2 domain-containing sensor protein